MMFLIKRYWKLITIFILISGVASAMYYLYQKNISLEVENAGQKVTLAQAQQSLIALDEDRRRADRVVVRNQQEQAVLQGKLREAQSKLEEMVNASSDECLVRHIPSNILDGL